MVAQLHDSSPPITTRRHIVAAAESDTHLSIQIRRSHVQHDCDHEYCTHVKSLYPGRNCHANEAGHHAEQQTQ